MASAETIATIRENIESIFRSGSRYQAEKLSVLMLYLALVVGTFFWAFSGGGAENELGATFGSEMLEQINKEIFFIENTSDDEWTNVYIIVNSFYRQRFEKVGSGERLILEPENLEYFFYIPRPWGREGWEELHSSPKPGRTAPTSMRPRLIQVRATQGKLDIDASKGKASTPGAT